MLKLKKEAKDLHIKNYKKLSKLELIVAIRDVNTKNTQTDMGYCDSCNKVRRKEFHRIYIKKLIADNWIHHPDGYSINSITGEVRAMIDYESKNF